MKTAIRVTVLVLALMFAGSVKSSMAAGEALIPVEIEAPRVAGAAVGFLPDYEGSDDYTFGIAPAFRYTFQKQERYIQLLANELSFNVLNHPNFRLGPVFTYHFGRNNQIDDRQVKRMKEIDGTIEGGIFADYVFRLSQNPRHRFIVGGLGQYDLGGESHGWKFTGSARYFHPVSTPIDLFVTTQLNFATKDYMDTYFAVDSEDSTRSGLPHYTAGGGAKDWALSGGLLFYLSRSWVTTAAVRYARLFSHAADSPIVDDRGSENQFFGGVGVAYMW
ncbi:MAG TPA: MipA/OmpV family protein [Candidatus Binatia bacterium]|jgi:Outer membrane protein V